MRSGAWAGSLAGGLSGCIKRLNKVLLSPLGAILDVGDVLEMGSCLRTRRLSPVPFWWKRAAGRVSERSGIVHMWQMTEHCDGRCQSLRSDEFGVSE